MVNSTIIFLCVATLNVCVMLTQLSGSVVRGPGLDDRCVEWVLYVVESVNEVAANLTTRAYTTGNLVCLQPYQVRQCNFTIISVG